MRLTRNNRSPKRIASGPGKSEQGNANWGQLGKQDRKKEPREFRATTNDHMWNLWLP